MKERFYQLRCNRRYQSRYYRRNSSEYIRESTCNSSSNTYGKDLRTRKLNLYINPRDILPSPLQPTLKSTSMMSSMKTNLDADDL
ncbi:hypothetical protein I4U23_026862 [Adineta vaga]|nr:hypothetical protein I4U23_026862 [Adineta vaga]